MGSIQLSRRKFLNSTGIVFLSAFFTAIGCSQRTKKKLPNIILCMTDDQGWGDIGYNGHPILKTPHLDSLSDQGIRFNRFYSGAPVCSPTRGSCLTGRHPYRYEIHTANDGHIKEEEITLAEVLKRHGYVTGHFGKWHLGTLTRIIEESNRGGPRGLAHYSPPWENGFDVCFSSEAKVPTWDPQKKPIKNASSRGWNYLKDSEKFEHYGTYYWDGPENIVTENLEGDDSQIIMDRVIPFIRNAVNKNTPFFTVIWFHSPHLPVIAGPKYSDMYKDFDLYTRNFYGCITAMDEQVGRLFSELEFLGVRNNTMFWFCSDNGPEGNAGEAPGSAGPFRGRKRSLYEGGVRVPAILVWPDKIKSSKKLDIPVVTSDYFPTILDVLDYQLTESQQRPYDGISILPIIEGKMKERSKPIAFESHNQISLSDNIYKIYSPDGGKNFELYNLIEDPAESKNLVLEKPEIVKDMKKILFDWRSSCVKSKNGFDY
jgi:arylsulfatase A-like enzyme